MASDAGQSGGPLVEAGQAGEASGAGGRGESGGTAASGGTSATEGGAPSVSGDGGMGGDDKPTEPVFTVSELIDDMEDGDATLLGSNGDWFVIKDATGGIITPAKGEPFLMSSLSPARDASTKAVAVTVSGFTGWGAAVGFDFSYVAAIKQPTDLKQALAVRFWAKANKVTSVRFQMPNQDTDALGGKCSGTADNACNAHFTKAFAVGTEWKETTVLLSDLQQDLPGRRVPSFDKQHVYSSFFVIGPNESVTVWIDDLALVH